VAHIWLYLLVPHQAAAPPSSCCKFILKEKCDLTIKVR
jgi:hypothetical protein